MTDVLIDARRGAGSSLEILYGTVTWKPTLTHSRGTSIVLPAPTTFDLVDGQVVATNVQPSPAPVGGQVEWAYEVTFKDRHSKSYSFLVGVPDSTSQVNFISLPRYFETKPPLFGQGPKGDPGETATVAVGTVTGGVTAQVTNSGTNTDAILNFVLPKGDKGDTGAGVPTGGTALQYIRKNSGNTTTEWATLSKTSVGLSNVDNTSDANKPVSTAQKTYIDNSNTLVYRFNTHASPPSTYPEGVTVFNVNAAPDGWPVVFGSLLQVRTERGRGNTAAVQTITGIGTTSSNDLASSRVLFRKSDQVDTWGDWQEFVSLSGLKNRSEVNVRDFGAVGDGVADDSEAFRQAALYIKGSFAEGGTIVALPAGKFNLGSQVRLFSNTTLDLGHSQITRTAGGGYVAFCAVAGAAVQGYGSGARNITIRNVRFKGNFATGRSLNNIFHHVDNLLIENCVFDEAVVSGHSVDLGGCSNVTIRKCIFRGRYEVAGRAYVEAVQIDHSTRSGVGGELVENSGAWDGLPCINITMEDCVSEPLTIGGTTYLAPRLIGSHSRVANLRHKDIKIRNVKITDSGPTDSDQNYRGWIHFTHTEGVTIEGYTAINTRNDDAIVLGFGSVGTTYPLSTVASSSPSLTTDSGPIACRDIRAQVQIVGNNQTVMHSAVILAGQTGASVDNVVLDIQAKNLHDGDIVAVDTGGTVLDMNYGWNVVANVQGNKVRRLVNATNSRCITANLSGSEIIHSGIRVSTAQTVNVVGGQLDSCGTFAYFSGVTNLMCSNNLATSNGATTRPYDGMVSVAGCNIVNASNNVFTDTAGNLVYGINFYNTTTSSAAFGNVGINFNTNVRVQSGSAVTVANSVDA